MDTINIKNKDKTIFDNNNSLEDDRELFMKLKTKLYLFIIFMNLQNILSNILIFLIDKDYTDNKTLSIFNKINISYNSLIFVISICFIILLRRKLIDELFKKNSKKAYSMAKSILFFVYLKTIFDQTLQIFSFLFNFANINKSTNSIKTNYNDLLVSTVILTNSVKFFSWNFFINVKGKNNYFNELLKIKNIWKMIFTCFLLYNMINLSYYIFWFQMSIVTFFLFFIESLIFNLFLFYDISIVNDNRKYNKNANLKLQFLIKINDFFKHILENNDYKVLFDLNDQLSEEVYSFTSDSEIIFDKINTNYIYNMLISSKKFKEFKSHISENYLENFSFSQKIENIKKIQKNKGRSKNSQEIFSIRSVDHKENFNLRKRESERKTFSKINLDKLSQEDDDLFSNRKPLKSKSFEIFKETNFLFLTKIESDKKSNKSKIYNELSSTSVNKQKFILERKISRDFDLNSKNTNPDQININYRKRFFNEKNLLFKKTSTCKIVDSLKKGLYKSLIQDHQRFVRSPKKNRSLYFYLKSKFYTLPYKFDERKKIFDHENISNNSNNLHINSQNKNETNISRGLSDETDKINIKFKENGNEELQLNNQEDFLIQNDHNENKDLVRRCKLIKLDTKENEIYKNLNIKSLNQSRGSYDISSIDEQIINFDNFILNSDLKIKKGIEKYFPCNENELKYNEYEISFEEKNDYNINNNKLPFIESFGNEDLFKNNKNTILDNLEENEKKSIFAGEYMKIRNNNSPIKDINILNEKNSLSPFKEKNNTNQRYISSENEIKDTKFKYFDYKNKNCFIKKYEKETSNFLNGDVHRIKNSQLELGMNNNNSFKKKGNKSKISQSNIFDFRRVSMIDRLNFSNFSNTSKGKASIKKHKRENSIDLVKFDSINSPLTEIRRRHYSKKNLNYKLEEKIEEYANDENINSDNFYNNLIKKYDEIKSNSKKIKLFYISLPEKLLRLLKANIKISKNDLKIEDEKNKSFNNLFGMKNIENSNLSKEVSENNNFHSKKDNNYFSDEFNINLHSKDKFLDESFKENFKKNDYRLNIKEKRDNLKSEEDHLYNISQDVALDKIIKNLFKNKKFRSNSFDQKIEYNLFFETLQGILLENEIGENLHEIGPLIISERIKHENKYVKDINGGQVISDLNNKNSSNQCLSEEIKTNKFYINFYFRKFIRKNSNKKNYFKVEQNLDLIPKKQINTKGVKKIIDSNIDNLDKSNTKLISNKSIFNLSRNNGPNEKTKNMNTNKILFVVKKIENIDYFIFKKILGVKCENLEQKQKQNKICKSKKEINSNNQLENQNFKGFNYKEDFNRSRTLKSLNDLKTQKYYTDIILKKIHNPSQSYKNLKISLPPQNNKEIVDITKNPCYNSNGNVNENINYLEIKKSYFNTSILKNNEILNKINHNYNLRDNNERPIYKNSTKKK